VIDIPDNVQAIDASELKPPPVEGRRSACSFRTRSAPLRGWMTSPVFHHDFAYVAPDCSTAAGRRRSGVSWAWTISPPSSSARPAPMTHRILLGKGDSNRRGPFARLPFPPGDYDLIVLPIIKLEDTKVRPSAGCPSETLMRERLT